MTYPPLKDLDFPAADPPPGPEDQQPSTPDPLGEGERILAEIPVESRESATRGNTDTPDSVTHFAADADIGETTAKLDELDDDELEELLEQVDLSDLSDLGELDESGALDAPSDGGNRLFMDAVVPASIKTDEAKAAAEIPMLTEVVQVPRYDSEDLPHSFAQVDWGDLSERVRENVLERLLRRSDALLDTQLQSTLSAVLERALDNVSHELHDALTRLIRDIVARAVTEELTRLHAEIAKRNRSDRPN